MVGGSVQPHALAHAHDNLSPPRHQCPLPAPSTHYRIFRNCERDVVERSISILQASGFYWGPLSVGEAHAKLDMEAMGTFLVRDSSQGNHLFSLSVKVAAGPISVRIRFQEGYFWLMNHFSDCVVKLLELVVERTQAQPICCENGVTLVFSKPLRRSRIPALQELCRRSIIAVHGREKIPQLPLQPVLRKYVEEFPFKI
ncbi:suppressor of cytokine signaling 1-like [Rhinatrema bivittatum]|uniref:suppressor of cytokine signaling 1-like n=1 Tax=Rhinatrema bivittatum TaxID=194408 RepID=UPI00112643E1|nr:suppressor of cytokine signaling 1-like [Rhinatrema bivittatum]XP_029446239.1 suppressor of cytokine signaling 1-like [Rhinatrema bivittatum]